MCAADINMVGKIWEYRPRSHKTEHYSTSMRSVSRATWRQEIIKPFLTTSTQAHLFDPTEARNGRGEKGRQYRRYNTGTRSCGAANMPLECLLLNREPCGLSKLPEGDRQAEYRRRLKRRWSGATSIAVSARNQRHNAATAVRREAGLATSCCVLGH